jgi:Caspase domain
MRTIKRALVVGIDNYGPSNSLSSCVNDAAAVAAVLETNGDNSTNFAVKLGKNILNKAVLAEEIENLFRYDADIALFYFSGHGYLDRTGGYIVTPDAARYEMGVSMDMILGFVNESPVKNKIVILDCCHSGSFGIPTFSKLNNANIGEGVTILTASLKDQAAIATNTYSVFSGLFLEALKGGAAEITGFITPASVYAYIDQALGPWHQRPVFKTNVQIFTPLRTVKPSVPQDILRKLPEYFDTVQTIHALNPTYEYTNTDVAIPEKVSIFKNLQKLVSVGLVTPVDEEHMYWAAQNSSGCMLTPLGKHYWNLVKGKKLF